MAALIAVNLFRAMTLPVTLGEAWNYDRFVAPPWRVALAHFDLNNHILNTLLIRMSTSRFHLTELSLRLPSLLFGLLYLWAVYRLTLRYFGSGPMFLVVFGLLTLNPMVLDAMSEARGYGMALALLICALDIMLQYNESFRAERFNEQFKCEVLAPRVSFRTLNFAAVALGLSVAASLAFATPAIALGTVFLAWGRGWALPKGQGIRFTLLALLTAFILVVIPINHPDERAFLAGATSLRQTINEMTALSLGTSLKVILATARVGIALAAVAGAAAALQGWRERPSALIVLSGGTLALSLIILLAAHRWLRAPFPHGGSVYLIPLSTLVITSLIFKWNHRAASIALYAAGTVVIAVYLSQLDFREYATGREYAGGRALAKALRADVGRRPVRIGVSEAAEPIVNYYRTRLRQGTWERIERKPLESGYPYYVLAGPDGALVEQWHLHVLYQEGGLILAR